MIKICVKSWRLFLDGQSGYRPRQLGEFEGHGVGGDRKC
jgi:hypothetical protein